MPIPRSDNIGLDVAERIGDKYGFEMVGEKHALGRFLCHVDSQNSVVANLSPWQKSSGGGLRVGVTFGVVRRDINLTQELIFGNTKGEFYPTLRERSPFLDRPGGQWLWDADRSEVNEWIDTWVPRIVQDTASLRFIENYWDLPLKESYTEMQLRGIRLDRAWPRITNQLLWGWTDEAEQELVVPLLKDVAHLEKYHDHRLEIESNIGEALAWATEHPNGLEREHVE